MFFFFFFFTYSNLQSVVIYGYYATYLIARARNNSTTSGLYDKNERPLVVAIYFCVGVVVSIGC